ncbi:MAG: DUF2834 domain-containing protein [Candidatus Phaeomarinobacter sp.]
MSKTAFEILCLLVAAAFTVFFVIVVLPPALESGDIVGAFAAGFVNPYASGYSLDTILCGMILIIWIIYDRSSLGVRHGLWVIPLIFVPGVATAFGIYLVLRLRQRGIETG